MTPTEPERTTPSEAGNPASHPPEEIACPWAGCRTTFLFEDEYIGQRYGCEGCGNLFAPVRCPRCGRARALRQVKNVRLLVETCACEKMVLSYAVCNRDGCKRVFPFPPESWVTGARCPGCGQALSLDALAPTVGKRYPLLERIGSGGFSAVYRSFHPDYMVPAAVKLPTNPSVTPTSDEGKRFRREIGILARLNHHGAASGSQNQGIVRIYDAGFQAERPYVVMEYLDGQSLNEAMIAAREERQSLDRVRLARIVRDIAQALGVAHRAEVVHRDVKPSNVMLTREGRVVLIDFGMALLGHSDLTGPKTSLGTPSYMSPEQTRGETLQPRSDVFSLGVVLHEALTNERLFGDANSDVAMHRIRSAPIPRPVSIDATVPPELDAIALRALMRDPGSRFADGMEMADALTDWLDSVAQQPSSKPSSAALRPPTVEPTKARPRSSWRNHPIREEILARRRQASTLGGSGRAALGRWFAPFRPLGLALGRLIGLAVIRGADEARARLEDLGDKLQEAGDGPAGPNPPGRREDSRRRAVPAESGEVGAAHDDPSWSASGSRSRPIPLDPTARPPSSRPFMTSESMTVTPRLVEIPTHLRATLTALEEAHRQCVEGDLRGALRSLAAVPRAARGSEWAYVQASARWPIQRRRIREDTEATVERIAVDPARTRAVTSGSDRKVRLRRIEDGRLGGSVRDLGDLGGEPKAWAWSPLADGPLAVAVRSRVVLIDVEARREDSRFVRSFAGPQPQCLAFSPSGRSLAAGLGFEVALWDPLRPDEAVMRLESHRKLVLDLAFAPRDDGTLVSASGDGTAIVWALGPGGWAPRHRLAHPAPAKVAATAFHPDGNSLATSTDEGAVTLWDVKTGQKLRDLAPRSRPIAARSLRFTPDGRRLIVAFADGGMLWLDAVVGGAVRELRDPTLPVADFAIGLRDDDLILALGRTGEAAYWRTGANAPTPPLSDCLRVAVSPDGSRVALARKGTGPEVREAHTLAPVWSSPGEPATALAFRPDGEILYVARGSERVEALDAVDGTRGGPIAAASLGGISALAVDPDSRLLAMADRAGGLAIHEIRQGTTREWPSTDPTIGIRVLTFSDEHHSRLLMATDAGGLRLFDPAEGVILAERDDVHDGAIESAAFGPSAEWIVTVGVDRRLRILDPVTLAPWLTLDRVEPIRSPTVSEVAGRTFAIDPTGALLVLPDDPNSAL